jgi:hypothetical protein
MRLGFFVGFLIGAAVASLLTQMHEKDAGVTVAPTLDESSPGPVDKLRRKFREAMSEGREAAEKKEAQMLVEFDRARQP